MLKNVCSFFIMKFLNIKTSITSIKQNSKRFKNVIIINIFRRLKKLKRLLKNVFFIKILSSKKKQMMNDFTINLSVFNIAFSINVEINFIEIIFSKIITFET